MNTLYVSTEYACVGNPNVLSKIVYYLNSPLLCSAGGEVAATFGQLRTLLSADLVTQIGAVYQFELTGGGEAGTWYMDLASAH